MCWGKATGFTSVTMGGLLIYKLAIIARHMRIALECIVGTALVIGGNVVAWYWLLANLGILKK